MTPTATTERFQLEKYKNHYSRHTCPQCKQKQQLALYIDTETGEPLADHLGRCNREGRCGYHYTPKQYFAAGGKRPESLNDTQAWQKPGPAPEPEEIDFLPADIAAASLDGKHHLSNNLFLFLAKRFGKAVALDLFARYLIGTSSHWKRASVYWQFDINHNIRQCKIMLYNAFTGKRVKDGEQVYKMNKATGRYSLETTEKACTLIYGKFLNKDTTELNLQQSFFGEHLLSEYPQMPVRIVESEKTALIASVYMPQYLWLATGGASGCKWRDYATYKVLKGRTVSFWPDYGYFNKKTVKTCFQEWTERCDRIKEALGPGTKIKVSDVVEKGLQGRERQDQDLADLLLMIDKETGLAVTEAGYPVLWDYKTEVSAAEYIERQQGVHKNTKF